MKRLLFGVIVVLLLVFALQNSFVVFRQVYRDLRFIIINPQLTYDEKMRIYWWGVYDLLQFVKKNTPERARILIPPQERPYLTSGNAGIVRYFIYPREPVMGGFVRNKIDNVDYVLITHGEWDDAQPEKYDWPKEKIRAKRVIYFDPKTKEEIVVEGDYDPANKNRFGGYGLIVLQKEEG